MRHWNSECGEWIIERVYQPNAAMADEPRQLQGSGNRARRCERVDRKVRDGNPGRFQFLASQAGGTETSNVRLKPRSVQSFRDQRKLPLASSQVKLASQ